MASDPILSKHHSTILNQIRLCSWNIRRGLVIREAELKSMISTYDLNILFLVETDTLAVNTELDYKIPGYKTIVQHKLNSESPTRIICLINEHMESSMKTRLDLTHTAFPSIWVEIENPMGKNIICGGFYREWAPGGDKSIQAQIGCQKPRNYECP